MIHLIASWSVLVMLAAIAVPLCMYCVKRGVEGRGVWIVAALVILLSGSFAAATLGWFWIPIKKPWNPSFCEEFPQACFWQRGQRESFELACDRAMGGSYHENECVIARLDCLARFTQVKVEAIIWSKSCEESVNAVRGIK